MAQKKNNTPLIIGGAVGCFVLCLCGVAIGLFVVMSSDGEDDYDYPSAVDTPSRPSGGTGRDISAEVSTMTTLFEGGSSEWDMAVKPLMLANYDSNASGWINTSAEVGLIPCATWKALDDGVKSKWGDSIRVIYGFEAGKLWVGSAVGFDESIRSSADSAAAACLSGASAAPAPPPATGGGGASAAIRAVPDGGSSAWDDKVKVIMVANYDTNGSGWVDTPSEVTSVPCDTWTALDAGVKQSYSYGLRAIYGFEPGYTWIGGAVGFGETQRVIADGKLVSCVGP